jgi:kynureninase
MSSGRQTGTVQIADAVAALGAGPLTEGLVRAHLRPLFRRTLASSENYLVNHTLGRPLDQMAEDVAEGTALWPDCLSSAWDPWLAEEKHYREAIAGVLGLPGADTVVPKASAGQALRAVLHSLPPGATVLATRGEFASVSFVLAQFAAMGRLQVVWADADSRGRWTADCLDRALRRLKGVRLVVSSLVFYADGQVFEDMPRLAAACREHGAELLVDAYHAVGALLVLPDELGCDYLIGGCYKYLRGGPGAAFLAIAPHRLPKLQRTLDVGWFAQSPGTSSFEDVGPYVLAGADGWQDGTPAVLPYYQARSGLALVRALGVERLRAYSLEQLRMLHGLLAERGIASVGGDAGHGAFLTVASDCAEVVVAQLGKQGIVIDTTLGRLRICPDMLTMREELVQVADALAESGMREQ